MSQEELIYLINTTICEWGVEEYSCNPESKESLIQRIEFNQESFLTELQESFNGE